MALNQYETDEQRAEVLIDWLKRNAGYLLLLVVVVVASIGGVEYYKHHKVQKLNEAFDRYDTFLTTYDNEPVDLGKSAVLISENEGVYQIFSALLLAKEAHGAGDYQGAEKLLKSALTVDLNDPGLKDLINYRLAIVQFDQGEDQQALVTLKEIQSSEFLGLRKVLEGDIYSALGEIEDAKIAYEEALSSEVVPDDARDKLHLLSAQ
ncbi:hypothetical protein B9T19_01160 [Ignatzschineria sp. F8392]|uniref:YfgM family protein n=1 Tax=Ignatzschineria sp. F8392 TaxID=1980117 RepID=UPI000B99BFAB|nr:tetratricopeptide repeat protein [Ignatzschineria sp. F8392]OYQ81317.1 hypothetical protein B9T19_01160 [Ignatzschineria sp. F8392]